MVTPIIVTIKNITDNKKDKIDNASASIIQHSTQYQNNLDSMDIVETKNTLDDQYLGESTKNINKNRKF
jgi:hypothetical protein